MPQQKCKSDYSAAAKMPSGEAQRMIRDPSQVGNSVVILCTKKIKLLTAGDISTGNIKLAHTANVFKEEQAIKAKDQANTVTIMFESTNQKKVLDYKSQVMNPDQEHLGIPGVPETNCSNKCKTEYP